MSGCLPFPACHSGALDNRMRNLIQPPLKWQSCVSADLPVCLEPVCPDKVPSRIGGIEYFPKHFDELDHHARRVHMVRMLLRIRCEKVLNHESGICPDCPHRRTRPARQTSRNQHFQQPGLLQQRGVCQTWGCGLTVTIPIYENCGGVWSDLHGVDARGCGHRRTGCRWRGHRSDGWHRFHRWGRRVPS